MRRLVTVSMVGCAVSSLSCGARDPEPVAAPIAPQVILIPPPGDEADAGGARQAAVDPTAAQPACPQGTFAEHGRCIRIVGSDEIPIWAPPTGHLDPCATLTSDNAVFDCDPQRENATDGGTRSRMKPR